MTITILNTLELPINYFQKKKPQNFPEVQWVQKGKFTPWQL